VAELLNSLDNISRRIPGFDFKDPSRRFVTISGEPVEDVVGNTMVWLNLVNRNVTTNTRRLRATWTPELAQDINVYHGIDAETELTTLLSEQVAEEINREVLNTFIDVSPLPPPRGELFYFHPQYNGEEINPTVFEDGSWYIGNTFKNVIGVEMTLKRHKFI
jgi:hypothetical protein